MKKLLLILAITHSSALLPGAPVAAPSSGDSSVSLAVLIRPADASSKYLAAEYARDLIHVFGGMERVTVAPRNAVLKAEASQAAPTETSRELHATHVLTGTVRQTGEDFEFATELIETSSGRKLWQHAIRSQLAAAADTSSVVARAVTEALGVIRAKSNPRERDVATASTRAWSDYLRGRRATETLDEPKLFEAIASFERAVAADPQFVVAQAALATAHIALGYNFQNPRVHFEKARQHLAEAGGARAMLAEAIIADAVLKFFHEWDWQAAARGAKFAAHTDSSAVETHACFLHCAQTAGHIDEGRHVLAMAQRAQPDSPALRSELPCASYYAGDLAAAEQQSRGALKDDPENPMLYWSLGRALAQQRRFDEALAALKVGQSKPGGEWTGILSEIAYIHGRQNRPAEAAATIAQLRKRAETEYVDHYLYAMAYSSLGETTQVLRHLEQAAADRSTWILSVALDPKFSGVRQEPGFQKLLQTLHLESTPALR